MTRGKKVFLFKAESPGGICCNPLPKTLTLSTYSTTEAKLSVNRCIKRELKEAFRFVYFFLSLVCWCVASVFLLR